MSYLCDTHIAIWSLLAPDKLSASQQTIISTGENAKFVSTISLWEISLKFSMGKLDLGGHTPDGFLEGLLEFGYQILPPRSEDFASFYRLPPVDNHKDPFDRMLAWQAMRNELTLLSHDNKLAIYANKGLKIT